MNDFLQRAAPTLSNSFLQAEGAGGSNEGAAGIDIPPSHSPQQTERETYLESKCLNWCFFCCLFKTKINGLAALYIQSKTDYPKEKSKLLCLFLF